MYVNNGFNRNYRRNGEYPGYFVSRENDYGTYDRNFSNVNDIQIKNSMLKNQYPEIYFDVNSIINEIIPKYRNMTFTEDVVNEMVEEIYAEYKEKNVRKEEKENNVRSAVSTKKEMRADDTIESKDTTRDLIKIVLLNRLIKVNIDNINFDMPQNNFEPFRARDYFDETNYMETRYEVPFMGYTPRNYF